MPYDADCELAALACLLYEPELMPQAARLTPGAFLTAAYSQIFGCMLELHQDGIAVELKPLLDRLSQRYGGVSVDWQAKLGDALERCKSAVNFSYYVERLADFAAKRRT